MACKLLYICLAAIACMPTLSTASPSRFSSSLNVNGSLPGYGSPPQHSASQDLQPRADKPFYLRIAALGASISNGYLSTDGNGYRKYLRDQLRLEGWLVNMVGSITTGTMKDNSNEGHLGWRIDQVTNSAIGNIVPEQPNLVLINVGTNNAAQNVNVSTISNDYIRLLDKLWLGIPNATVILSTLLVNKNTETNARANTINDAIRTTVFSHYAGRKLVIAEMNDGFITTADFADETHPNDAGYKRMASVWWAAFQTAEDNKWLTAPPDVGISDSPTESTKHTCPKVYGNGDGNYQIQKGSGTDDGNYVHASADQGVVWISEFKIDTKDTNYGDNIFFAQLVNFGGIRGSEVDEIIIAQLKGGEWEWTFFVNKNIEKYGQEFGNAVTFDPGYKCTPGASRFADLNNNGLDDYLCIDGKGNLLASLNRGGNPPVFAPIGIIGKAPAFWSDGYTVDTVHMADIDGDGRADWCILLHTGDIACQRNGGQGVAPTAAYGGFWQAFDVVGGAWTTVFKSQHRGNGNGVNLVDINGDFKTDWLFMDNTGKVDAFINFRGIGVGMKPDWRNAGVTHGGLATFGVTNANTAVKFGRMYGTGRRDYIWARAVPVSPSSTQAVITLSVWKNLGTGGTYQKGDGTHYCDMDGDGRDDYVWVGPNGRIDVYLNNGNRPYWDNYGNVITLGVPRKTIHVADLDGDGKCDLLSVDRTSGAVRMWLNKFDTKTKTWAFVDHGIVSGSASCNEGYGVIENDLGVRFADLTGDGRADYLCGETSGRFTGYLNRGMTASGKISFEKVGQIKSATGYDRQNVRFKDVNGDGKADLLWISKYTGDTTVWYNGGEIPTSGSHFKWDFQGPLYRAWDRGSNMNFGALSGQHRADIIQVVPRTNVAYVSYNKCSSGSGGGDDANMGDPKLPAYTPTTAQAVVSFPDDTCSMDLQKSIREELGYTLEMAAETAANVQSGEYFKIFFDQRSVAHEDFLLNTARVYGNIVSMLKGEFFSVAVTCNTTKPDCTDKAFLAHMNDDRIKKVGRVNLCERFWTAKEIVSTKSILDTCGTKTPDLKVVQRSRSSVLLHEMTHTAFAMSSTTKTYDYAYGYTFCRQLAANTFDRSCMIRKMPGKGHKVMCPDPITGEEGRCSDTLSLQNADTYSFVGAGVWFSSKCGKPIPLPALATRSIGDRRETCPVNSDAIFFDEESPISGSYVHFGDSYGAGMGTGTTTRDKCRVGSNNFGKLLFAWMDDASIHYEEKVCSGDTLNGLTGQISSWSNPGSASLGTLSIGGNDVGFGDIAYYCVLTPNTYHWGSTNRGYCTDAEKKAVDYMSDTGTSGLRYKLKEAYLSILKRSGQDFFHLYVTSYVHFFNAATTDCDDTSFHYFWGGYKPSSDWPLSRIVYLSTDLRSELNTLVDKLNTVIAGAVSDANAEHGSTQVHFVDMTKSFDNGHRWCENPKGEFHEPNASRDDTWFFLSGWGDVSIDAAGASNTNSTDDAELAELVSSGKIPLPDAKTCTAALGTDPDPYAVAMCRVSITIDEDPSGPAAVNYRAASASIASGDFNAEDIGWLRFTRQIKTFHPRSNGMVAYRDAIITTMQEVGQA